MSDDLIKKEEAKEAVCKGCLKDWGICQHHWDCPMLTNLEMLPTADRPQGWIPCSERLPEYRKTVLISTYWGVKTGFLDSTEAYGDFWEIIEDDATAALHSIYAWMPLPEPWKGESREA